VMIIRIEFSDIVHINGFVSSNIADKHWYRYSEIPMNSKCVSVKIISNFTKKSEFTFNIAWLCNHLQTCMPSYDLRAGVAGQLIIPSAVRTTN
jgi:hypothetical protein